MLDETRLETRLAALQQDLKTRPVLGHLTMADAFTLRGVDERGNVGLFALVLLPVGVMLDFSDLATLRQNLVLKVRQITSAFPAWPIVVHGLAEVVDGQQLPGGREFYEQLKAELKARPIPAPRRPSGPEHPAVDFQALAQAATTSGKRTVKQGGPSPRTSKAARR